jgi:hydroxyacylglutathione hydrolase
MGTSFWRLDLGITSCYLLKAAEGYLLIDTAYAKDYRKFLRRLAALKISPKEIHTLLLTHHHDDHAGFAARLQAETGCRLIVHRKAVDPLGRGRAEDTLRPVNACTGAVLALFSLVHGEFSYPPLTVTVEDVVLAGDDHELLPGAGIAGSILCTPGHTADSLSVVLADGSAFVGDAAMNFLRFCGTRHRPIFVEDMEAVRASWDKLAAHGARRIYPAHGRPFPADRLALRGLRRRLDG